MVLSARAAGLNKKETAWAQIVAWYFENPQDTLDQLNAYIEASAGETGHPSFRKEVMWWLERNRR